MIYNLTVPGPIDDVEEVRVLEWHCVAGSTVAAGAMLVELETHKAVVEVRAGRAAVLRSVLCAAGQWQRIGHPLALLSDDPGEALPDMADAADPLPVAFEVI
jgi:pyruvate/2-oxoglutarate dehydrogenase complex dihydrolipoamide acyltransferase (E2) component